MISFILEECERFSDVDFPSHPNISRTSSLSKLNYEFVTVDPCGSGRRSTPALLDCGMEVSMVGSDMVHVERHEGEAYHMVAEDVELVAVAPSYWMTQDAQPSVPKLGGSVVTANTTTVVTKLCNETAFRKYIVVFKPSAAKSSVEEIITKLSGVGGKIVHKLDIIHGLAVEAPASFIKSISDFAGIDYIEEDGPVHTFGEPEAL
ncbi:hypothetical protein HDU67_005145 [Dinochytrium kinnereticum]|nr:hypothetical protein HDU67_005145 [Dinochytrium kinnereticum]